MVYCSLTGSHVYPDLMETIARCMNLHYHLKWQILDYNFLCYRLSRFDTEMPADSSRWPPTSGRHPAACMDELWFGFMWWQHRVTDLCLSCKTKLTRPAFTGPGFHIFPGKHLTTLYSLALDLILVLILKCHLGRDTKWDRPENRLWPIIGCDEWTLCLSSHRDKMDIQLSSSFPPPLSYLVV
jgi:hypothetical protein